MCFHCEHVLERLGDCGHYQKVLVTTVLFPLAMLTALQSSTLHNELIPDHWCYVRELANFSYGEQHRLIRPRIKTDLDYHLSEQLSQCEMYDLDYRAVIVGLEVVTKGSGNESIISVGSLPTKSCADGWSFNRAQYRASAAMQYGFVCKHKNDIDTIKLIRKFASALFAPVYAIFGDRYGRRVGMILVLLIYTASAVSPLATTDYVAFIVCQTLSGSAFPFGIFTVIVIGVEFMTPPHRSHVILCTWIAYYFGEWISFLLTQFLSHWIWITACNAICVLPCFVLLLMRADETPQWILARSNDSGRLKSIFEKLNCANKANVDDDSLRSIVSKFTHFADFEARQRKQSPELQNTSPSCIKTIARSSSTANDTKENEKDDDDDDEADEQSEAYFAKVRLFLKRSTLFQMMFLFAFVLLTNDMLIEFMQRERAKFTENLVLDRFFGSLIKMPAVMLTWYLIEQRIGRRWSNCAIMSLNLGTLTAALVIRLWFGTIAWLGVTVSMLGIMLAECSTIIIVLQTIELSPTRFRLLILSVTYCLGKVASTSLTYAFHLHSLRVLFNVYTQIIILLTFMLLSILIGAFVAETRNEFLPLGLLASEQLMTNVRFWSLSRKKSDITPSNLFLSMSKWDINANHQIVGSIKHMEKFTDS